MNHDEYWKKVWAEAHARLGRLFKECSRDVADLVGDENGIDSYEDAKCVLAYAMKHAEDCGERACAILSVGEALQAWHELQEHSSQAGA